MVVIPREEGGPRRRAAYSQSIDELLGATPTTVITKQLTADGTVDFHSISTAIEPTERTPPAAGLRLTDRPATRHGSRNGSNTVGTTSSTGSSVVNSSSASSASSSSSAAIVRTAESTDQSMSSRLGSARPASGSVNVWSREDDGDVEVADGAADSERGAENIALDDNDTISRHSPELHIFSEASSFSSKLEKLHNRSISAVTVAPMAVDESQPRLVHSLTKVPSVILERNESAASIEAPQISGEIESKSEADNNSTKSLSRSKASIPTVRLEESVASDQHSVVLVSGERRKWNQPMEHGEPAVQRSLDEAIERPLPLTRSKTISTSATVQNRQPASSATNPSIRAPNEENNSRTSIGPPFVSRFSALIPTNGDSKTGSKAKAKASPSQTPPKVVPPPAKPKPQSRAPVQRPFASSANRKPPPPTANKTTNGDLPFQSTLSSQGRAQPSGGGFELWLKQKEERERKRRRNIEQQKADEEQRKAEKKRDAERSFERWKTERDAMLAAERQKRERVKSARERKEQSAKAEKKKDAERTFEHWRQSHMKEMKRRRTRSASAEHRHTENLSKKAAAKKEEAERAYDNWLREKREKKLSAETRKREVEQSEVERKKNEAEYKQQLSKDAYDLWLQLKHEERKYSNSLAYKILEFETVARCRWPSTPWLPTGNTVARRFVGAGQRRMTLERPLQLRRSRGATTTTVTRTPTSAAGGGVRSRAVSRARSLH